MKRRTLLQRALGLAALSLSGCAAPPAGPGPEAAGVPTYRRVVDLSHVVRADVPYLPGEPPTRLERDDAGQLRRLTIGARTGTSLTIQRPPGMDGPSLEDLSPRDLVLPAICLDLRDQAQERADYRLDEATILAWETIHGPIPRGAAVLLATGWDLRWGDEAAYLGLDHAREPQVPGLSAAAAQLLLGGRRVRALGLDAPALPLAGGTDFWLQIANLTSLEQLPPTGALLMLGPLKLQAGNGGPVRALGLVF